MNRAKLVCGRVIRGVIGALVATAGSASGQVSYLWTAGGDGVSFGQGSNWTPTGVPGLLDEAKFDSGLVQSATLAANHGIDTLSVENNTTTLNLGARTLTARALVVGDRLGDVGSLTIAGGTLTTGTGLARLGRFAPSAGTLVINSGATMSNLDDLIIGDEGGGTLQINAGGSVSSDIVFLADESGSSGNAIVRGAWNLSNSLLVGNGGDGSVSISNGGDLTTTREFKVGDNLGSSGVVSVSGAGSTLTSSLLSSVGNFGPGSLAISGGAVVTTPGLRIGEDAQGDVTVDGSGSKLISSALINVSVSGVGSLILANSGVVQCSSVAVGALGTLGGSGSVTGAVTNAGVVRPGNSAGILSTGGFSQTTGALNIELGGANPGTGYDQLVVSGAATLGGTLNVTLINGYNPASGTFTIIQGGAVSGTFLVQNLPAGFTITYQADRVVVSKAGCIADFNGDGAVNTVDVLLFLNKWVAKDPAADVNGDGTVNTVDVIVFLNLWTAGC